VLAVVLSVAACSGGDAADPTTTRTRPEVPTLVGSWERIGGDFSELTGMVVTVESAGADGIITSTPTNEYGFVVGDIKWAAITEVGPGEYTFDDLIRETANDSTSYVAGTLTINEDRTTLEMAFASGTIQEWSRTG